MRIEHHAFGEHIAGTPAPSPTLEEALREVWAARWKDTRWGRTGIALSELSIKTLHAIAGPALTVAEVTPGMLRQATNAWKVQGLAPSTINTRLNCLSAMGVEVSGCRVRVPRTLKWWLSPEAEVELVAKLRETTTPRMLDLADFIEWTTRSGLRIEESLRLTWAEVRVTPARTCITVPGLKTGAAQATLPVSEEAAAILERRRGGLQPLQALPRVPVGNPPAVRVVSRKVAQVGRFAIIVREGLTPPPPRPVASTTRRKADTSLVFDLTYPDLQIAWKEARELLGLANPRIATLKALRRSAARSLHATKGMPLDMVRQYLRHGNVETTMGYLRLTGGYGENEMAKWL